MSDPRSHQEMDRTIILANNLNRKKLRTDSYFISSVIVKSDTLSITATYAGGCKEHDFELFAWKYFVRADGETQAYLVLSHNSHSDACKMNILKDLRFDIDPLKSEFQKVYHCQTGTIYLLIDSVKKRYDF